MHHMYTKPKGGDALCPLGFHPQVRWPTRCKRCFRDYKEHGGNKKDDSSSTASLRRDAFTASTPALSSWTTPQPSNRSRESSSSSSGLGSSDSESVRSRVTSASSTDLSRTDDPADVSITLSSPRRKAASWTSTPDLKNLDEDTTSVTIRMPRVRTRAAVQAAEPAKVEPKPAEKETTDYRSAQYTFRRRTLDLTRTDSTEKKPELTSSASVDSVSSSTTTERQRVRRTLTQPTIEEPTATTPVRKRISPPESTAGSVKSTTSSKSTTASNRADLDFMMKVKSSSAAKKTESTNLLRPSEKEREKKVSSSSSSEEDTDESDDASSIACTDTTETTIIDNRNDDEIAELKREIDTLKARCEKAERDKSDILLRRLGGTRETAPSGAEALKLQQRVNELQQAVEDLRDEKKSLTLRVKELEEENEAATTREPEMRRTIEDLRGKLSAAETLCEELMDENEEIKKEIRDLEEEIDEMQDNFREEQADEYTTLKKELEQTAKNCRILQFKLRKSERKSESLEAAKLEIERQMGDKGGNMQVMEKVRQLEKDLKLQSEVSERLQKETEDLKAQLIKEKSRPTAPSKVTLDAIKKKAPMLAKSADGKPVTRASLTRGGSQDDPVQLLRDLQDAMEREADLREQLRFAEEEVWARFLHDLFYDIENQEREQDRNSVLESIAKPREDGDGMESDQDQFLEDEELECEIDKQAVVESLLKLLLKIEKNPISTDFDFCLDELFQDNSIEINQPQPNSQFIEIQIDPKSQSPAPEQNSKQKTKMPAVSVEQNNPPLIQITEENEIDESLILLFGENEVPDDATFVEVPAPSPPPARVSPTSSVGLMLSWVAQSLGSILPAPRPTPSLAVLRPGTPVGATSSSEATLPPLLQDRRNSPSPARLSTPEPAFPEKDEGIAEDDDPAELRLQLELNEQESAVLRRKVEDLEKSNDGAKRQIKELQEKLTSKASSVASPTSPRSVRSDLRPATSSAAVLEKKISVLEEESSDLRKKLIEKERDYERLQTELTLAQKRSKTSARSRSLDSSEQAQDLKRQLQVIEQEASVLRTKTQELETDNEKLTTENRKLSIRTARAGTPAKETSEANGKLVSELKEKIAKLEKDLLEANKLKEKKPATLPPISPAAAVIEVEKLKNQLSKVEKENELLKEGGSRLRTRTPKKPTDLTTKLQMKKMVEDLEVEVAELLAGLSKAQDGKAEATNTQAAASSKELEEIKKERDILKAELTKTKTAYEKDKLKSETDAKKLGTDVSKTKDEIAKLQSENKTLKESLDKLKSTQETAKKTLDEKTKVQTELEEAKALASAFQRESEERVKEEAKKNEAEQAKLQKEITEKAKKLADAEKRVKEVEDKLKKTEKILIGKKDKLSKAEKDLEAEKEKVKQSESTQKEVSVGWLRERDELKANAAEMTRKVDQLQEQLNGRVREVETLEGSLESERERVAELLSSNESSKRATNAAVQKQLESAREELSAAKTRASEISAQLEKAEKAKKEADDKAKKEISDLQKKLTEAEGGRASDCKRLELQVKEKEQEARSLNIQLKSAQQDSGSSNKKINELQDELGKKIKELEKELAEEKQEYDDLTSRYEQLETEHVVTKAQLTMDREKAEGTVDMAHQELTTLESELQTLRETYNAKQDEWIKEKLEMQTVVREMEEMLQRNSSDNLDNKRLKALLDEKSSEMDKTKYELDVLNDQHSNLKKEAEDLRRKLEDFDRVSKIQRNMTADTAALEKEIKQLKTKISQDEKTHKGEVAQMKLRYDSRVKLISEEMQTLQTQVSKFKKERDSQRHMLEAAQKTIGDLKSSGSSGGKLTPTSVNFEGEESEETRTKVASLEQSMACLEDELSDTRLEASKLKTELISERSAWEVKISEMQSRLNEFEEDRLISSGRTKIPGIRTRIELAWQKEREEQHRLLQETSTLARDLRQTLFEVERERDKERLEAKRKQDQLKKSMEEELDENRKKITDMQYDLLELRDAHAKLRTTNEKFRRERERHDKERDDQRQVSNTRKRQEADEERKVNALLEQVEDLMRLAPDLFPPKQESSGSTLALPSAPSRTRGPRSRETSPATGNVREASVGVEDRRQQLQSTLARLTEATTEMRRYQKLGEDERDRDRARRNLGFRRAASTETEPTLDDKKRSSKSNGSGKKGLFRKSLSLEQTGGMGQDQKIWSGDGGSMDSIDAGSEMSLDNRFMSLPRRETSLDRLSTESTQSEMLPDKKKKQSFLGKLKKLASSRSIDDTDDRSGLQAGSMGGSGSDVSVDISTAGSTSGKKDTKGKLLGLFKKGPSRSSSVDRSSADKEAASMAGSTDSLQRPLRASSASRPLAPPSTTPAPTTPAPAVKRYVR